MRQVPGYPLWLGHVGDARDIRAVLNTGILAVADLAGNELPIAYPRDVSYCRFPLVDGTDNPPWLLRSAIACVSEWVRAGTPTLVFCSAGLSRTPAVTAVSLARTAGNSPTDMLKLVTGDAGHDVSPGLWIDLLSAMETI